MRAAASRLSRAAHATRRTSARSASLAKAAQQRPITRSTSSSVTETVLKGRSRPTSRARKTGSRILVAAAAASAALSTSPTASKRSGSTKRKPTKRSRASAAATTTVAVCPAYLLGASGSLAKSRVDTASKTIEGASPAVSWARSVVAASELPICSDGSDMKQVLGKLDGGLDLSMESAILDKHHKTIAIGVDEAGRGPLCGPVVAAAVTVLPEASAASSHSAGRQEVPLLGVTDSKLLSEAEREALACSLMRHPRIRWAVAAADAQAIEKHNILRASLDCMTVAADAVAEQINETETISSPVHVFVDGNRMPPAFKGRILQQQQQQQQQEHGEDKEAITSAIIKEAITDSDVHAVSDAASSSRSKRTKSAVATSGKEEEQSLRGFSAETLVKGDSRCYSIAAASILAKVLRDHIMVELDHTYPDYSMAGHKGYPTPAHMAIVKTIGPSRVHRLTFAPLKGHWERAADGSPQPIAHDDDDDD